MNVVRYPSPRAFLDAVEPFLLADEACHNLLLGIPARLIAQHSPIDTLYLAAAVDRGEVACAAMMTPPWNLVLSKTTRPNAIRGLAADIAAIRPAPPGVNGVAELAEQFAVAWRELTGERVEPVLRERIHRLDVVRPLSPVAGRLRLAAAEDRSLLVDWLEAFAGEAFPPGSRPPTDAAAIVEARLGTPGEGLVLWEDIKPRCVVGYGSVTRNGIRIGPVYTPPEHRNHG